ncbi:MAG: peptidase Ste24p [Candidatus Solibacter sp.]|nr:peptidase Ste24p [Candidatus Solibacter sp.]
MHRLLTLVLAAPALLAQPDRGVNFYSIGKEQALGAQLAAEYRKGVTVIDNAMVNAYLNDLGQRLAAKTAGQTFTYTFELVDANPRFLNEPAAFPGGPIFIPAQLILAAKSEDELAGMLAHSIAHIAARHGTKQATKDQIVNQATVPLIYMGGSQGYALQQGQTLAVPFGFVKFQRQLELQADSLAVQTMAAAGYDPSSLADYIERAQPPDNLPPPSISPLPGRTARLESIRTAIDALPPATYPPHDAFAGIQEEAARLNVRPAKAPPRLAR